MKFDWKDPVEWCFLLMFICALVLLILTILEGFK
jgi:hypothetical protein